MTFETFSRPLTKDIIMALVKRLLPPWGAYLIHDNRPYRADRCTVTAGQADFLIDFGKAVFIPEDGAVRTGGFAGAAAFAVILADTDTLFGNIGIVVGGHGTI